MNRQEFPGAMTVIDEMLGTHIIAAGFQFRLCVEGALYAPEDEIPGKGAFDLQFSAVTARNHVMRHLTRRLGANQDAWPQSARLFLMQDLGQYQYSAKTDGTLVAVRRTGRQEDRDARCP